MFSSNFRHLNLLSKYSKKYPRSVSIVSSVHYKDFSDIKSFSTDDKIDLTGRVVKCLWRINFLLKVHFVINQCTLQSAARGRTRLFDVDIKTSLDV